MISPLANATLFHIGPAPITSAVAVTWGLMAFLVGGAFLATRRLSLGAIVASSLPPQLSWIEPLSNVPVIA